LKKVAIFTSNHRYADDWGGTVKEAFGERAAEPTRGDFSATDLDALVLKLRAGQYDGLGFCLNSPQNGLLVRKIRAHRLNLELFACNFVEASADLNIARDSFNGVWFTAPKIDEEFKARYRKEFLTTDHIFSAALFYIAAKILQQAADNSSERGFTMALQEVKEIKLGGQIVPIIRNNTDWYLDLEFGVYKFNNGMIVTDE
jgi:ABC-type branched-subunit amino acid transport system substrate-binding protein